MADPANPITPAPEVTKKTDEPTIAPATAQVAPEVTAQLFQRLDDTFEAMRGVVSAYAHGDQLTLNVADKLTVLNGATIALTFSVIGLISSKFTQAHPALDREHLYRAWWLFGYSMIACITCQVFGLRASILSQVHVSTGLTQLRANLLKNTISKILPMDEVGKVIEAMPKTRRIGIKLGDWLRHSSAITLVGAQVLTVCGFIQLLWFIQANSDALLSGAK